MRAAIDHVIGRPDVDPDRLAILGYSFGGCLAPAPPRRNPRIRAVVANTLGVDFGSVSGGAPGHAVEATGLRRRRRVRQLARASVTARFFLESGKDAFGIESGSEFLKA